MNWLAAKTDGFDLSTDHKNLIFLLYLLSVIPDLSHTSLRKVLRAEVKLSTYNYTCFHIRVEEEVWVDLPSRWSATQIVQRLVYVM